MSLTFSIGKIPHYYFAKQCWLLPSLCISRIISNPFDEDLWVSYGIVVQFGFWNAAIAYKYTYAK